MVLERDEDRGFGDGYYIYNFMSSETDELIASFFEKESIPLPKEGDSVELERLSITSTTVEDDESIGEYIVEDISYKYSLAKPNEEWLQESGDVPDKLITLVTLKVSPTD